MAVRVAINGFGRIGRLVYRRSQDIDNIDVVAVNDITNPKTLAHLLKYDSVHGRFPGEVRVDEERIIAGNDSFLVLSQRNPLELPWGDIGVDVVVESTGLFRTREKAGFHLEAGAKKVIISAPAKGRPGADLTIVMGVNHQLFDPEIHHVISTASCTTNCLAPVAKVLNDAFGIESGIMTTIHAYTNDQKILDLPHTDLRRARAAAVNMIPTSTGAAIAIGLVIPELDGKLDGMAVRVPVMDASVVDLVCNLGKDATVEEVNRAVRDASESYLNGYLEYSEEQLVSSDIIGNAHSSVFDSEFTRMVGSRMLKVLSWYDNEYGYAARMVDMLELIGGKSS